MSPNLMTTPDLLLFAAQHAERERLQAHTVTHDVVRALCDRLSAPPPSPGNPNKPAVKTMSGPSQDQALDPLSLKERLSKAAKADELEAKCKQVEGELHLYKSGQYHAANEWDDLNRRHRDLQSQHDDMRSLADDKVKEVAKLEERILAVDDVLEELNDSLAEIADDVKPKACKDAVAAAINRIGQARNELLPTAPAEGGGNPPPPVDAAGDLWERS